MQTKAFILTLIATGLITACSGSTGEAERTGPWTLDAAESGMTYITVKNNDLGEINTFREISGSVSETGNAVFTINLDSVDTANETRDPRMREHVFKTASFPMAKASAQLDMTQFESLPIGNSETVLLDVNIELAGYATQRDFYVQVTRLGVNKVVVNNKAPLILEVAEFGMEEGIETLRGLAGLDTISPVVPVTMSLVFER